MADRAQAREAVLPFEPVDERGNGAGGIAFWNGVGILTLAVDDQHRAVEPDAIDLSAKATRRLRSDAIERELDARRAAVQDEEGGVAHVVTGRSKRR